MNLPPYAGPAQWLWYFGFRGFCIMVLIFLMLPLLIIIPLSFTSTPYFVFTHKMLTLDPAGYSLRWYHHLFTDPSWMHAIRNSFIIAPIATLIATILGTLAALGLSRSHMPLKQFISSLLILPMVVPLIITATAVFFYFSSLHLVNTYIGIIIVHSILGIPFVVITVTATLAGFDYQLVRASQSMGASPWYTFFKVTMPLVMPGIISGALFAFMTSFDEVVVVMFLAGPEQRTLPLQMWVNLRYNINPTILAIATLIILLSVVMLLTLELLRRRNARMRGLE
ncbi:polyamine ABC transporter permease [Acidihalobacter ferrooxydans]|uniref:Polyamine ABC transporter permease n=1 Tax=Acidihalobacter ferrooxydans TaxID=1765967 RepID=A0A1P8ULP4_9GAMM|nr:polyamine ABC transporter permease [Acidihalobacter ferrooxydans]